MFVDETEQFFASSGAHALLFGVAEEILRHGTHGFVPRGAKPALNITEPLSLHLVHGRSHTGKFFGESRCLFPFFAARVPSFYQGHHEPICGKELV